MNVSAGYADVLVGLQYGDEGKAKIVDILASEYDIIARFNGGANAGHTIDTPHGFAKLMQVPSGAFHPDKVLYIGSGCAVNIVKLAAEIEALTALGADLEGRLFISHRSVVVQRSMSSRTMRRDKGSARPATVSDRAMQTSQHVCVGASALQCSCETSLGTKITPSG